MTIGALAFLNPWLLAALATLPIIYWLLRTVPPRPKQVEFPPTRILVGIDNKDKEPAKTPWWLMLIRLLAAALAILALAEPILNPSNDRALKGSGPVVVVIDNGWSAAPRWAERLKTVDRIINEAEAQRRPVIVLPTAVAAKAQPIKIDAPSAARSTAAALTPQPFAPDRLAAATALEAALANTKEASLIWVTDGVDHQGEAKAFGERIAALARGGGTSVVEDSRWAEALGTVGGVGRDGRLQAIVMRPPGPARDGVVHAFSVRGQRLGEARFQLSGNETSKTVGFDLPLELRNQVTRIEIADERSAGAVSLLDARSQWQRIGLVSGESREQAQPLLAPLYYIEKAMAPFSEIVRPENSNLAGGIDTVLKQGATVLVLADIGTLTGDVKDRVDAWVRKGGVLVRFSGPRLEKGSDDLLPVPLRIGGRTLGGALSWSQPQALAAFEEKSLFAGLQIPPDVLVNRQVLADPARLGVDTAVWARLKDGTPLVTASKRGQGQLVLFHITANSDWSNLPISGLFVEMLQRIATLGRAGAGGEAAAADNSGAGAGADVLPPVQTLDGFGILKQPPPTAQSLAETKLRDLVASLDHPPGYYGSAGTPRALNVLGPKSTLLPLPTLSSGIERISYGSETSTSMKPWLLAVALALIFADIIAILILQGAGSMLTRRTKPGAAVAGGMLMAFVAALAMVSSTADAQTRREIPPRGDQKPAATSSLKGNDAVALKATGKVTLGYVLSGDPATDDVSRSGLMGLATILKLRTAVEPGEPIGVNIETDEIGFYPLLYWPVVDSARPLDEAALARIDAYMKQGGLIIFDTRDQGQGMPTGFSLSPQGGSTLQRLLGRLDLPRLEPVPTDHVLTKAFYLLRSFPGRWDGGQLWVEASSDSDTDDTRKARRADGVTSILITSNDFASAWSLDERGRPIYPVVPGGENQRELSFRTGVNIVMHALTGNYKADQVHVPALIERLGQ
ncbi:MAG: hypothetical protein CTY20_06060 [Hyphomicrobium sp.]|nr:MAG: hypothetical protein CTY20_06060 [Hyphomicrobium sp.]